MGVRRGGGGAQPGAGRKKGVPNKITQFNIAKAMATGAMPLDIALDIMRKRHARLEALMKKKGVSELQITEAENLTLEAAEATMPYLHHKLQSIQHKVEPIDLTKLTDEELRLVLALKRRLGDTPSATTH